MYKLFNVPTVQEVPVNIEWDENVFLFATKMISAKKIETIIFMDLARQETPGVEIFEHLTGAELKTWVDLSLPLSAPAGEELIRLKSSAP